MKNFRAALCLAAAASAFALLPAKLCAETPAPSGFKFGMLLPLSGSYAVVGEDSRLGFEVGSALAPSGPRIELEYADSKADAATAVTEFRKLSSVNILGVFAMRGPVGMAVNPLSKSSGISLFGGVGNKDFTTENKYAFQMWSKSDEEGAFLAKKLGEHGFKKVAMLTAQDDWPTSVSAGFRGSIGAAGTAIVYDQESVPTETDFRTQLLQIKAKSPDVVLANLALAQIGPFLRQAREQKLTAVVYSNFFASKKDAVDSAGTTNIEGLRFIEMDTALPKFREALAAKSVTTPSGASLAGYAAAMLLGQAAAEHPAIHTAEELYSALAEQKEIRTPDGPFPIVDRAVKFPLVEKVIHDGKAQTMQ